MRVRRATRLAPWIVAAIAAAVTAPPAGAQPVQRIAPLRYAATLQALRNVRIPVLLPSAFDTNSAPRGVAARTREASAGGYSVEFELPPACYGARVCRYARIEGGVPGNGPPTYVPRRCTPGCGDASIEFRYGTVRYRFSMKGATHAVLMRGLGSLRRYR